MVFTWKYCVSNTPLIKHMSAQRVVIRIASLHDLCVNAWTTPTSGTCHSSDSGLCMHSTLHCITFQCNDSIPLCHSAIMWKEPRGAALKSSTKSSTKKAAPKTYAEELTLTLPSDQHSINAEAEKQRNSEAENQRTRETQKQRSRA